MDVEPILEAHRNRWTLPPYYAMRAAILVAAGFFAFEQDWASVASTVFVFALISTPAILKYRYKVYLPFALEFGIVALIFATLFLGHLANFYDHIPLWDKFVHFQSGLILGAAGFVIVYVLNEQRTLHLELSPGFVAFFAITFALAMGAAWEMLEFAADELLAIAWQNGNADTMWDLIAAGVGALIVCVYSYVWMWREARLPFTPRLFNFIREKGRAAARSLARKS